MVHALYLREDVSEAGGAIGGEEVECPGRHARGRAIECCAAHDECCGGLAQRPEKLEAGWLIVDMSRQRREEDGL